MAETIAGLLREGSRRLCATETPRLEAELLLARALGRPRSHLYAWPEAAVAAEAAAAFRALLGRRAAGEPIAHILGRREFWSLELEVSPAVLIPRPETERLVELALARIPPDAHWTLVDLGTGSGAVALALARERPRCRVLAADRDPGALDLARRNAARLGMAVALWRGDWGAALAGGSVDVLVSNPPYIRADDPHLDRGDLRHEPRGALVAADGGLAAIRRLAGDARRVLRPGGWLLVEHGWDQGPEAAACLAAAGLVEVRTQRDGAGRDRVGLARQPG